MNFAMAVLSLWLILYGNSYAAPNKDENSLQGKCSKSAEIFFNQKFGTELHKNAKSHDSTTYTYHYNKKQNKCFVLFFIQGYPDDKSKSDSINILLHDMNDNKELGSLFQNFSDPKRPKPDCIILGKPSVSCSREEWDAFVLPYMHE